MNQGHTHCHQSQELRRLEAQKRYGYPPLPKGLTAWNCRCLPVRGLAHTAEGVISLLRCLLAFYFLLILTSFIPTSRWYDVPPQLQLAITGLRCVHGSHMDPKQEWLL